MTKDKKITYKITITAIFAALTYVGTLINIPLPTGGQVHLGNFVCILAALLCGGGVGGISGSLGMGLFDITSHPVPATIIRTFIIKFIVGFTVGVLFRFLLKKKINSSLTLSILGCLFMLIFVTTLYIYIVKNGSIQLNGTKEVTISIILPIVSGLFSILLFEMAIFARYLNRIQKITLFTCTIGILINIIGEFILRIFLTIIFDGLTFDAALVISITRLPSSFLTGIITAIFITLVYYPLYLATKNINYLNDIK